ncbi:GNAT family N-acetyltransferase [Acidiphilium sp.]|uniref:GNAT family N-acetyltransferase n=1 Tax=Acidiphilium sp. TaxID=527 RepID=UPI003D02329D
MAVTARDAAPQDYAWIAPILRATWGGSHMAVGGALVDLMSLAALVVPEIGVLTYRTRGDDVEIVSLTASPSGTGIGSALVEALAVRAIAERRVAILATTTNDNLAALGFYQRRGFVVHAIDIEAVAAARILKPEIPLIAANRIPIRDEIVLRRDLRVKPFPHPETHPKG